LGASSPCEGRVTFVLCGYGGATALRREPARERETDVLDEAGQHQVRLRSGALRVPRIAPLAGAGHGARLRVAPQVLRSPVARQSAVRGAVEAIYVAQRGGARPERVGEVRALEGRGLEGDRYSEGTGHWSRFGMRACEVTLVEAEDLEAMEGGAGVRVTDGEHRRNVVIRGLDLDDLRRKRFRIGEAIFEYQKPCSICRHVERLTEPGMTEALKGRGGICARVIEGQTIREGDPIIVL
jgi:MOSC domain-containing protein YiiM